MTNPNDIHTMFSRAVTETTSLYEHTVNLTVDHRQLTLRLAETQAMLDAALDRNIELEKELAQRPIYLEGPARDAEQAWQEAKDELGWQAVVDRNRDWMIAANNKTTEDD